MKIVQKNSYIDQKTGEEIEVTPEQQIGMSKIIGWIGIGLLVILVLIFGWEIYQNSKMIKVTGTVLSIGSQSSSSGNQARAGSSGGEATSYSHEFSYTDRNGTAQVGSTGAPDRDSHYSVGDQVSIGYLESDPSQVRIRSWFRMWKIQLVLFGLGIALLWYKRISIREIEAQQEIAGR